MDFREYQVRAMSTCMDTSRNMSYMGWGLVGETGEFASKIAKGIRKNEYYIGKSMDDVDYPSDSDLHYNLPLLEDEEWLKKENDLKAELGDILWFVAGIAEVMGWGLEDVALCNLEKLASRKRRGVIEGDGDNR